MKKYFSFTLALLLLFVSLCGCSSNKREWMNYDMSKYVTLADCSSIEVDLESEDFITHMDELIKSQLTEKSLTVTEKLSEGTVIEGDTVNIAFVGKIDGEEFQGGSADSYDLVVGSNSFIDGFEDGLIGVELGKTVDLDLKFPDRYPNSPELEGQPVVFTVTVNSITRTKYPDIDDEILAKLGYTTFEDFKTKMVATTVQDFVWNYVLMNSEILKQPEKEIEDMVNEAVNYYTVYAMQTGITIEEFMGQNGMTVEQFRTTMTENAKNGYIDKYIIAYALVDAYDLYSEEIFENKLAEIAEQSAISIEELVDNNDPITLEREIYTTLAVEFLASKVVYKNK